MNSVVVALIGFGALIVLGLLPSVALGRAARRRGRRFWPWFVAGILLWPAGVIALFAIRDLTEPDEVDRLRGRVAALEEREAIRKAAAATPVPVAPPPDFLGRDN